MINLLASLRSLVLTCIALMIIGNTYSKVVTNMLHCDNNNGHKEHTQCYKPKRDLALDSALITLYPERYQPVILHVKKHDSFAEMLQISQKLIFLRDTLALCDTVIWQTKIDLSDDTADVILNSLDSLFIKRTTPVIDSIVYSRYFTSEPEYPIRFSLYCKGDTLTEDIKFKIWTEEGHRIYSQPFLNIIHILFNNEEQLFKQFINMRLSNS